MISLYSPFAPSGGSWNVGRENGELKLAVFGFNAVVPHIVSDATTRTKFRIAS